MYKFCKPKLPVENWYIDDMMTIHKKKNYKQILFLIEGTSHTSGNLTITLGHISSQGFLTKCASKYQGNVPQKKEEKKERNNNLFYFLSIVAWSGTNCIKIYSLWSFIQHGWGV